MWEGGKESKGHVEDEKEKEGALSPLGGWSVLGMTLSDLMDPLSRPLGHVATNNTPQTVCVCVGVSLICF